MLYSISISVVELKNLGARASVYSCNRRIIFMNVSGLYAPHTNSTHIYYQIALKSSIVQSKLTFKSRLDTSKWNQFENLFQYDNKKVSHAYKHFALKSERFFGFRINACICEGCIRKKYVNI